AAFGLGHNPVNHAQPEAILGRNLQGFGDLLGPSRIPEADGRRALGGDHRIAGVLPHEDADCDTQRQCSAAASLADHDTNDRPRSCPTTTTVRPRRSPSTPTVAGSSPSWRSPCSSTKRVNKRVM